MEIQYKKKDFVKPSDQELCKGVDMINKGDYKSALDYFQKACANHDNELATILAASIYFVGFNVVKQDLNTAIKLFQLAAKKWNNRVAQYMMGMFYIDGVIENKEGDGDENQDAFNWISKSAESGWNLAQARLGSLYSGKYDGIPKDKEKSIYWYEKVLAEAHLGGRVGEHLYLFGDKRLKVNLSKVESYLLKSAYSTCNGALVPIKKVVVTHDCEPLKEIGEITFWVAMSDPDIGIAACQYKLGLLHNGTDQYDILSDKNDLIENEEAIKWMMESAKNGNGFAQIIIGNNYEKGIVFQKDYTEAHKWYTICHQQGNVVASYRLGSLYYHGVGVKKDLKKALGYLEHGLTFFPHAESSYLAGTIYESGLPHSGVKQDFTRAMEYYATATKGGVPFGAANAGVIFLEGRPGIKQCYAKAFALLVIAAGLECPYGQFSLGLMYLNGYLVDVNFDKALVLFKDALKGGYGPAQFEIDKVEMVKSIDSLLNPICNKQCANNMCHKGNNKKKKKSAKKGDKKKKQVIDE